MKPVDFEPQNRYVRILEEAARIREQRQKERWLRVELARKAWAKKTDLLRLVKG